MTYDPFEQSRRLPSPDNHPEERTPALGKPRTRRRFVVEAIGGLAGVALVGACGSSDEPSEGTGSGGDGGSGGSGGSGTGGSAGSAGSGNTGGSSAGAAGNATGGASGSSGASGAAGSAGAAGADSGTCALYPRQTAGPFYLDLDLLRSDITEGKAGAPLTLEIQVVRANDCAPLKDAVVDVWQCDADGVYAGFPGQLGGLDTTGQKFLRGSQISGADGRVVFQTIYPGWYPGRTTHIHFKVHLSATSEVTSQLYFPEEKTTSVYQAPPYAARGPKDTSNAADAIAQVGGFPPVLAITEDATGLTATLVVTVLG
jgi:protocatechuate 3,4-dioxygenase beta subunit